MRQAALPLFVRQGRALCGAANRSQPVTAEPRNLPSNASSRSVHLLFLALEGAPSRSIVKARGKPLSATRKGSGEGCNSPGNGPPWRSAGLLVFAEDGIHHRGAQLTFAVRCGRIGPDWLGWSDLELY